MRCALGSDTGEAGLNEMRVQRYRVQFHGGGTIRVQFKMQANHVLIAILHSFYRLVAIDRGFVSLVHELSFTVGIWSMFLFTILLDTKSYIIVLLNTSLKSPEYCVELD